MGNETEIDVQYVIDGKSGSVNLAMTESRSSAYLNLTKNSRALFDHDTANICLESIFFAFIPDLFSSFNTSLSSFTLLFFHANSEHVLGLELNSEAANARTELRH